MRQRWASNQTSFKVTVGRKLFVNKWWLYSIVARNSSFVTLRLEKQRYALSNHLFKWHARCAQYVCTTRASAHIVFLSFCGQKCRDDDESAHRWRLFLVLSVRIDMLFGRLRANFCFRLLFCQLGRVCVNDCCWRGDCPKATKKFWETTPKGLRQTKFCPK